MKTDDVREMIRTEMRTEMSASEDRLLEKMKTVMKEIMKEEIYKLNTVIEKQNEVINSLTVRVNELEQYSRRSNIQITNVAEMPNEDLEKMICEVGEKIGIKINMKQDIQAIHRVPTKSANSPKPIIVKFTNRMQRNNFIKEAKKKKLKCNQLNSTQDILFSNNKSIYFNDHLTPHNSKIFYEARKCVTEKNAKSAWTRDGKIYLKRDDMSPPVQITSIKNLDTFRSSYSGAAAKTQS
uniref:FP protein C-terminal domain-containing protein n=1 Tax=Cacopsylla melanoneura TaxID=428564 RepID=A0A8D9FB52_9HEMI